MCSRRRTALFLATALIAGCPPALALRAAAAEDTAAVVRATRPDGLVEVAGAGGEASLGARVDFLRHAPPAGPGQAPTWWRIGWGRVVGPVPGGVLVRVEGTSPGFAPGPGDAAVVEAGAAAGATGAAGEAGDRRPAGGRPGGAPGPLGALPEPASSSHGGGDTVTFRVGLQGAYVHSFQTSPEHAPADDRAGKEGPGGGGGLFLEGRLSRHFGIETGLLLERNTRKKTNANYGPNGTSLTFHPRILVTNLRVPLILEGIVPLSTSGPEGASLDFGIGPELVAPLSARTEVDFEVGGDPTNRKEAEAEARAIGERYRVEETIAVFLTMGFGLAVKAGPAAILMGLRASWNPWTDNPYGGIYGDVAEESTHTLDARATLGLAFDVPVK